jgi:hypothetical protein
MPAAPDIDVGDPPEIAVVSPEAVKKAKVQLNCAKQAKDQGTLLQSQACKASMLLDCNPE